MPNITTEIIKKICSLLKYINEEDFKLFLNELHPDTTNQSIINKIGAIIEIHGSDFLLQQLNLKIEDEFLKYKKIDISIQQTYKQILDLVLKEFDIKFEDFKKPYKRRRDEKKDVYSIIAFILYNSFDLDIDVIAYLLNTSQRNSYYFLEYVNESNLKYNKKLINSLIIVTNKIHHDGTK